MGILLCPARGIVNQPPDQGIAHVPGCDYLHKATQIIAQDKARFPCEIAPLLCQVNPAAAPWFEAREGSSALSKPVVVKWCIEIGAQIFRKGALGRNRSGAFPQPETDFLEQLVFENGFNWLVGA